VGFGLAFDANHTIVGELKFGNPNAGQSTPIYYTFSCSRDLVVGDKINIKLPGSIVNGTESRITTAIGCGTATFTARAEFTISATSVDGTSHSPTWGYMATSDAVIEENTVLWINRNYALTAPVPATMRGAVLARGRLKDPAANTIVQVSVSQSADLWVCFQIDTGQDGGFPASLPLANFTRSTSTLSHSGSNDIIHCYTKEVPGGITSLPATTTAQTIFFMAAKPITTSSSSGVVLTVTSDYVVNTECTVVIPPGLATTPLIAHPADYPGYTHSAASTLVWNNSATGVEYAIVPAWSIAPTVVGSSNAILPGLQCGDIKSMYASETCCEDNAKDVFYIDYTLKCIALKKEFKAQQCCNAATSKPFMWPTACPPTEPNKCWSGECKLVASDCPAIPPTPTGGITRRKAGEEVLSKPRTASVVERMKVLHDLYKQGMLTKQEFDSVKKKIIDSFLR